LTINDLGLRPTPRRVKLLTVSGLALVFAKTFVAEPPAVLVDVAREVVLLQLARVDPVTVVSLNGRGLGLRVEPIDVLIFHTVPHNRKKYSTTSENVKAFLEVFIPYPLPLSLPPTPHQRALVHEKKA